MRSKVSSAALAVVIAWAALVEGGAAGAACFRIVGANVHLPGGKAEVTDVVIDGERIASVGAGAVAPAGCSSVDGKGMQLTAGLVDAWSQLGLMGIELEGSTVDLDQQTPYQDSGHLVRAAVRGSLAYDERSIPIGVARLGGVTSVFVAPEGGVVSGQGFWVDLAGETRAASIRKDPAGMVAAWSLRPSRASAAFVLDLALREAVLWEKARPEWEKNRRHDFTTAALDLEALGPVVRGEVPLVIQVDRAADIEALLASTAGTKVKLVIVGGAEAWVVAAALAERAVPVVVDPLLNAPYAFDQLRARADNAALLRAAGVPVLMSTFNTHQTRKLRQVAGNAVRAGMPWEAALEAVTEAPAKAFGMTGYGRIEPGAMADVVLWSGDPFELATRVTRLWIHGADVPLRSRQTELFERYRRL
ncbi:MAG: amidohydrolase family protein [Myxococcota bacterium]